MLPAFEPREMQSEAKSEGRLMAATGKYAGVISWSREAHPEIGEYGPPDVLFQFGEVPGMEGWQKFR